MGFLQNIFSRNSTTANISVPSEKRNSAIDVEVSRILSRLEKEFLQPDIDVSEDASLAISAVWACVRIISESVATLPIHLKQKTTAGRETVYDHAVCDLIDRPNPHMNGVTLLEALMVSVVLWGNGYAHISKRDKSYRPIRLDFIMPQEVSLSVATDDVYYRINGSDMVPSRDIIHIKGLSVDGIKGISPISRHRENLQLTMQAQYFGVQFFKNGCHSTGVFETDSEYSDVAYDRLLKQLSERYFGLANAGRPLLLEGGLKFNKITIPPEDAQFIATRKFQKTEIATIFGVPPHMIADLERATNNNIEHQGMEFVQYCLMPYIVKLEAEFEEKLLRYDERGKLYVKFETNALMRSDAKTRGEFYAIMKRNGLMTANEIRAKEDMNRYEGGDHYFIEANMQTVENAINTSLLIPKTK